MVGGGSVFLMAHQSGVADAYWINDFYDPVYAFWATVKDKTENQKMRENLTATVTAIKPA
jgi:site-specific DNA-adenine methylase